MLVCVSCARACVCVWREREREREAAKYLSDTCVRQLRQQRAGVVRTVCRRVCEWSRPGLQVSTTPSSHSAPLLSPVLLSVWTFYLLSLYTVSDFGLCERACVCLSVYVYVYVRCERACLCIVRARARVCVWRERERGRETQQNI